MTTPITYSNAALKVYVLQQQPRLVLGDQDLKFKGHPLELFIYLADQGKSEFPRNKLVEELYGERADPATLRQSALFHLPNALKEQFIDSSDPTVIRFIQEKVWIDSIAFTKRANALLAQTPLTDPQQIDEAQAILVLYQSHFLQDYLPKADGLVGWRDERQEQLAKLRHSLFDQIIQYHFGRAEFAEAQEIAEKWRDSLEPGLVPLQYLIWIAAHRHQHAQLEVYLEELRKKEKKEKNHQPNRAECGHMAAVLTAAILCAAVTSAYAHEYPQQIVR